MSAEPNREPMMYLDNLRIYGEWLETMESDAKGVPTINGIRASTVELQRGWIDVDNRVS